MIDYEIMSVKPYHKKGKFLGVVVVIRNLDTDEIYCGKGKSDQEAKRNAIDQMRKKR